jgi:hypothetical protein
VGSGAFRTLECDELDVAVDVVDEDGDVLVETGPQTVLQQL